MVFVSIFSNATNYYISPSGNDTNTGTSTTSPWRTVSKVQASNKLPGDQFLFERGGSYSGEIAMATSGTAGSEIVFGAYGSGNLPILKGSVSVTGWTVHSGNIYKATVASPVKYVYINGVLQQLARFPNTGWLLAGNCSNSQLTSTGITQPSGTWNGGELVIRSTNFSYENSLISNQTGNTITYGNLVYNPSNFSWGFFLRNKLSALDTEGEWFYDSTNGTLYLWAPGNTNPNTLNVEASIHDYGVKVGTWSAPRNNIRVENIKFMHYKLAGVKTEGGANNITVTNCAFEELYHGIDSYFASNNKYLNSTFLKTYATAIHALDNNTLVERNRLNDIAMLPGMGETFFGYFGIQVGGLNNIVRENRIINTGYSGIFGDSNALIEKNFVKGFLCTLNDGGGIYWDSGSGITVQDNIVVDPVGNLSSVAANNPVTVRLGFGIYFGNAQITGARVQRNTVVNCDMGVWVDHTMASSDNRVIDNTLFGNLNSQIGFSDYSNTNGPTAVAPYSVSAYNGVFTGNICYAKSNTQLVSYHVNRWNGNVSFGTFSNNRYINPWNSSSFRLQKFLPSYGDTYYNLTQWKTLKGGEVGSTESAVSLTFPNGVNDHIIVYNDSLFTRSVSLPTGTWQDLSGAQYTGSISLGTFQSKPLFKSTPVPPVPPGSSPSSNKPVLVNAVVQANAIVLNWVSYSTGTGFAIHRKLKTATSWGTALANVGSTTTTYTDNTAAPNTYYEYRVTRNGTNVGYGYCASAINLAPIDYRGKIILVVDNTMTTPLANEINILKNDLKADGWQVLQINASRTDFPVNIKNQIVALYNADPANVKAVYILGHIPVYRSGNIAPDGHELRPFATDLYYGDMGSSTWLNPNPTTIPSSIELEVGRVDMFNMPSFPLSETELLRRYLNKAHAFKIKQVVPQNRALIKDNLSWLSQPLCEMSYRNFGPLVGNDNITSLRCATCVTGSTATFVSEATNASGYLWTYGSGGGTYTSADGIGTTTDFVNSPHNGVFNMVCGSYFGNWDKIDAESNCFLKAPLASNGMALTNIWAGQPNVWFHHMGMGDHIGYSTRITANNTGSSALYQFQNTGWEPNGYTTIAIGLMGDPSLRMNYITPPSNFVVASAGGGNLTFSWNSSPESGLAGYHIYDLTSGVPVRLTSNPVTASPVTLISAGTEFMVKAVKLHTSPSGTYFNTSLGIGATVTQSANCTLAAKIWLQGPYNGVDMNDNLRSANLIPLSDPYPSFGYTHVNGGGATVTSAVLAVTGSNAIIDWIVVEVRNSTTPTQRVYTTSALLQRDGDIVATNGTSPVTLPVPPGQYHISVRHRNHLGVMTASPINLTTGSTLNMSTTTLWGTDPMTSIGGVNLLWAGDASFDGVIKYSGSGNDRDLILSRIGGIVPTNTVSGYFSEDINMNGVTSYTGIGNDRDIILLNIGGTIPTNTKNQQLPN